MKVLSTICRPTKHGWHATVRLDTGTEIEKVCATLVEALDFCRQIGRGMK